MKKYQILNDSIANNLLEEHGFCRLPPINVDELSALIDFFRQKIEVTGKGLEQNFISIMSDNELVRVGHSQFIGRCLRSYLETHLTGHNLVLASYFAKPFGPNRVGLHQDPTLVDFELYDDYSIWIPLVDTVEPNSGRLVVIPKSHGANNRLTVSDFEYLTSQSSYAQENSHTLNVKMGEPIIFFNRTIHGSEPNLLFDIRPAVTIKVAPKPAKVVSFFFPDLPNRIVELREQDQEFYQCFGFKMILDEEIKPFKVVKF